MNSQKVREKPTELEEMGMGLEVTKYFLITQEEYDSFLVIFCCFHVAESQPKSLSQQQDFFFNDRNS